MLDFTLKGKFWPDAEMLSEIVQAVCDCPIRESDSLFLTPQTKLAVMRAIITKYPYMKEKIK